MENQSSSSSSSTKMQFLLLEQVQFLKVNDDNLLQWELVDVVDAEEEEWEQGGDKVGDNTDVDGFGSFESPPNSPTNEDLIDGIQHLLPHLVAFLDDHGGHVNDDDDDDDVGGGGGGGDDDDDDNGYDLDDELVPWDVGNKFGRQRMRKLGKRASSKMHNSKRNPHLFTRPGCVRGKHGLGLKHTC